jgi:hypothetical protein
MYRVLAGYRPELEAKGFRMGVLTGELVLAAGTPAAKRIRVVVSTLWEAAWAEVHIPGRAVR